VFFGVDDVEQRPDDLFLVSVYFRLT